MTKVIHLILMLIPFYGLNAHAQSAPSPCDEQGEATVSYQSSDSEDTLMVRVVGNPCSKADLIIRVTSKAGDTLYHYQADFIDHMPYLIYEPELNGLVEFFVQKVLGTAITRSTDSLPEYAERETYYEANNDYVLISQEQYEALQKKSQPILWHITGESTWAHSIYDESTGSSVRIMDGGVFY